MYIFETIFATILLQTYLDRIKWSDTSGVALSVDEIDDDNTGTFAPFLRDKTCRNVPPNGPDDFVLDSFLGR